ncbi:MULTISPECIES: bifunctional DNA-formamidopyrimidine glycosylase/DNA-(apurinic or apyrimidinic site) lyase [Mesorhizobium]|uniref:Formamidopyrimidine-DNA glycosylase n=1 Tax=Mesorhizobium denitrificans TaxID=2294114 RepID=A0A371XK14_9HYPH|nr:MULTISPECIES: bifunctional DNA-formamidopyrimidine glycosylase/DNA-(apurinic or apyrimidinic site) lyase [Mesorhizobium]RFC69562.1 bifunctional DNA-formamidopyrimidine glycosylase/DNA-(apurinic or apyrimidinic site) lyase [Mesorhizobium denitrificans]
MPELPEVETVRRGLAPVMEGGRITGLLTRRADLRFPLPEKFAESLTGKTVISVGRRAKYLLIEASDAPLLISHLGMSGSFRIEATGGPATPGLFHHPRSKDEKHDHVVFEIGHEDGRTYRIIYNDPRRFGFMLFAQDRETHPMLAELGVEPTGNAFDGPTLASLFRGRSAPIKSAMLDQRLIAGLGNIYVSEALWRAGISPKRSAGSIVPEKQDTGARTDRLADAIRAVIAEAVEAGGSSLRDHRQTDGSLGYFQHRFAVYDREGEPCLHAGCTGTVRRIAQAGRSTFYCPVCQR